LCIRNSPKSWCDDGARGESVLGADPAESQGRNGVQQSRRVLCADCKIRGRQVLGGTRGRARAAAFFKIGGSEKKRSAKSGSGGSEEATEKNGSRRCFRFLWRAVRRSADALTPTWSARRQLAVADYTRSIELVSNDAVV